MLAILVTKINHTIQLLLYLQQQRLVKMLAKADTVQILTLKQNVLDINPDSAFCNLISWQ